MVIQSSSPVQKEVILINPCISNFFLEIAFGAKTGNPLPHSLLILAALTPKEYKVRFINHKLFWTADDFCEGALVGITCLTMMVSKAYELADSFRAAGSKVVLGGPHVNALPEEALEHADSVVVGEAESVWVRVIDDFEKGRLQKVYRGEPLDDFFSPTFDYLMLFDPAVLRRTGMHIDRGCKYNCDFCSRVSDKLRFIKIEQVVALVRRAATAPFFGLRQPPLVFIADNIFSKPAYAKELFRALAPLKIRWGANASIDIGFDEEALRLAKESGCQAFLIGFETIHPEAYRKTSLAQVRSADDYRKAIRNINAHRIKITGSFIIGLDQYTHLDYLKLLLFLVRARLWFSILTILTPVPGSALFTRLKAEGRIFSFDWSRYNFLNCVFKPKNVSVFSVYAWFVLIRFVSMFFSPWMLFFMAGLFLSQNLGLWLGHGLARMFR